MVSQCISYDSSLHRQNEIVPDSARICCTVRINLVCQPFHKEENCFLPRLDDRHIYQVS